eukprot:CAMPEP_0174375776 /NCGR_PEP_ID=MMETSP0811_2-20130205/115797_1 /TAXON_ID=73025 ORGANISM="Eutreptiella gymnastica-like, Strain CCMP1594" /NCGR_SAMPLE_ID=MMETSP0811_2 /ASSEMBLY_ACC=CAM_ASM_000667 /LENGTH=103 /DNA_ID=CAMNT_0015526341 /DNA_START=23 /DNA_END=330 /DNA_ORIENTATION=+
MASYVRIKRHKQTIFLHCELTDHALTLKEKISLINNVPIENQRLLLDKQVLEDAASLQEQGIQNDTVLFLVYRIDGEEEKWEDVHIYEPQPKQDGPAPPAEGA